MEHHCRACQQIIYVELEEVPQQAMEEVAMQAGLASLRTMMNPKDPECPVRQLVAERQKRARTQAPLSRGSSSDVCPKCGLRVCDGLCQGLRKVPECAGEPCGDQPFVRVFCPCWAKSTEKMGKTKFSILDFFGFFKVFQAG